MAAALVCIVANGGDKQDETEPARVGGGAGPRGRIAGPAAPAAVPASVWTTVEGYWNIDDEARRNNLAGVRAELTPDGQAIAKRNADVAAARTARGEVVGLGTYICGVNGVPNQYTISEPWALVVTPGEVVQAVERYSIVPRHFYMDGRAWPDLSRMPPASNGYSLGRWEGKDLVVETRGMPAGGVAGGGLKAPTTVLTERFSVSPDGKRLTVSLSFVDPALYARPHSYRIEYDRADRHTYAYGEFCDPTEDPANLVSDPEQEPAR